MTQEEIMKLVTSKDGYIGHAMSIPHERQNKAHELVDFGFNTHFGAWPM